MHAATNKRSGSRYTEGKLLQTSPQREVETILTTGMLQRTAINSSEDISKEGEDMGSLVCWDSYNCLQLTDGVNRVECLWVRTRGKDN